MGFFFKLQHDLVLLLFTQDEDTFRMAYDGGQNVVVSLNKQQQNQATLWLTLKKKNPSLLALPFISDRELCFVYNIHKFPYVWRWSACGSNQWGD